ncbi:hypothetical protein [Haliangium sp.]|uniref:hypothetical protein n=1 Tax=Haliangium sp. TaxID=2663208 RepID=UPI003D10D362
MTSPAPRAIGIWWFAFGYFACYVPYSALTKAVSSGMPASLAAPVDGFRLLPLSALVSMIGMLVFLSAMRWWKYAHHVTIAGRRLPCPRRWTLLSGLCTTTIIGTTTLAYTFSGVSIVFMMLLMRGGVLVIAPIVDAATGRRVRWFSWVALGLSLGALVVAFAERGGYAMTVVAAVDVIAYLASYFVRLRFMSKLAKSHDTRQRTAYFVEEQMVASPALVALLVLCAAVGQGELMMNIRAGFTELWAGGVYGYVLLIGLFSQGTGIFGGLILLDHREHTYCVPVNRSSSILAGVLASLSLFWLFPDARPPSLFQLAGAAMILAAILFLTVPVLVEKRATRP